MDKTTVGIYVVRHEGADREEDPEDVGILVEGVIVLQGIEDVAVAMAFLFGIIYVLNLSYPNELRYSFEFVQKVLMGMGDHRRLSDKVQLLKNKMCA